jgi:hypothetical protein
VHDHHNKITRFTLACTLFRRDHGACTLHHTFGEKQLKISSRGGSYTWLIITSRLTSPPFRLTCVTSPWFFIMPDATEKDFNSGSDDNSGSHVAIYERPTGIKGIYYHPITQVSMLGFVCFMCPGITRRRIRFLTSFSLGFCRSLQCPHGIGRWRTGRPYNQCKSQLNSLCHFRCRSIFFRVIVTFSIHLNLNLLLASSSINNKLGSRITLLLGSIGYALYIGSFLQVFTSSQSPMGGIHVLFQRNEYTP